MHGLKQLYSLFSSPKSNPKTKAAMAASSRGRDPLSQATKAKTALSSVKKETAASSVSPSLSKKAPGDRHREAERKERSKDTGVRTTSDSTKRESGDPKQRASKERPSEQDRRRQQQQRQGEDSQAKKGGNRSSQPPKPPTTATSSHTSGRRDNKVSSSSSGSVKSSEQPHRDSRTHHTGSGALREHGTRRAEPSKPPERGGRDTRKVASERERKSESKEREGRSESKGRSREGEQRTRSRVSDSQGSKDKDKKAVSDTGKKISVHEEPPPVAEGAGVGVAGGGGSEGALGGRGEREERLQPMMEVEDGYSYDEDFEVSQTLSCPL